jgi:outer membrane receptor protein involved in Fe transport
MNRIQFLLSTTLLGCAVIAHPAFAQNAPAPAAAQAQVLQEVVVTAEHRTSTAQKTAASVSVRTGSDMLTQGRYQLSDILEDVPGISGGAANGVSTTIQGLGTDNPASGLTIRGVQSNAGAGGSVTSTAASAAATTSTASKSCAGLRARSTAAARLRAWSPSTPTILAPRSSAPMPRRNSATTTCATLPAT